MEVQDPSGVVREVFERIRRVTDIVKWFPFFYLLLFIVYLFLGLFVPDAVVCWMDSLFYVSPFVIVFILILEIYFKLCKWHKTACILPLLPGLVGIVDSYFFTFTQEEIIGINIFLLFFFLLFFLPRIGILLVRYG